MISVTKRSQWGQGASMPCHSTGLDFTISTYSEHSLEHGSTSQAASYVGLAWGDGSTTWGAGTDTDIIRAGIKALVSAVNNK